MHRTHRTHIFAAGAAIALATLAATAANAAPAETCDILVQQDTGDISELTLPNGYSVIEKTAAPDFAIVPGPGAKLIGFACDRGDIAPADNDWKILQQGYVLHIRSGGLEGVLSLSGSEVKFRLTDRKARMGSMASSKVDEQLAKFQAQLAAHPPVPPAPPAPAAPPAPPSPPAPDAAPAETPAPTDTTAPTPAQ